MDSNRLVLSYVCTLLNKSFQVLGMPFPNPSNMTQVREENSWKEGKPADQTNAAADHYNRDVQRPAGWPRGWTCDG